jgi:hypothetical protein
LEQATESERSIAALSTATVESYRRAEFTACLQAADELETRFGSTKFGKLYIALCKRYMEGPPEGAFDATISLTDK